jgi:hypothetical protein
MVIVFLPGQSRGVIGRDGEVPGARLVRDRNPW